MCVFIGYSPSHRGYQCLDLETNTVYVSRHVVFDENRFPFLEKQHPPSRITSNQPTSLPPAIRLTQDSRIPLPHITTPVSSNDPPRSPIAHSSPNITASTASPILDPPITTVAQPEPHSHVLDALQQPVATSQHSMRTRSHNNIVQSKVYTDGTIRYPLPKALLATCDHAIVEPTCYTQAAKHPEWRKAMNDEFDALMRNGTWTLVKPSGNQSIVGCKWVFRVKYCADGKIARYKARLVAKGFHQQHGLDYDETFSPVIKHTTIRLILSYALSQNWSIRQIDISNAFLHGFLSETVLMQQPPGFVHSQFPNHVCLLRKALYGLKQAPRAWFSRLSAKLYSMGFKNSRADTSLFVRRSSIGCIFVLIYVDDMIITGSHSSIITDFITSLGADFAVKDLGDLHHFLGVEVSRGPDFLHLTQRQYIAKLLDKTGMLTAKPVSTPMSPSLPLSSTEGAPFEDPTLYRSTIEALNYLAFTRPDISFVVNRLCQFMHRPLVQHWGAVKRVLRYLKHSIDLGIIFRRNVPHTLQAYGDADWAGDPDNRRSTTGFRIYFGGNLISWGSRKQATVARSSTEAEYRALANTTSEVIWLTFLLRELGIPLIHSPTIWCDNIGATYMAANPVFHARTKHVEIDFHFVREKVASRAIQVSFISTRDQLADVFTKPLSSGRFEALRDKLQVRSLPFSLEGACK